MSSVDALYHELLLSHSKRPYNRGPLPGATHRAQGDNPLCGDRYDVYVRIEGDCIVDAAFEGAGCAISLAAASLMTVGVKGLSRGDVEDLSGRFVRFLGGDHAVDLGDLQAFAGVSRFPVRIACARLPWEALARAIGIPRGG